jgi:hypothetical protein
MSLRQPVRGRKYPPPHDEVSSALSQLVSATGKAGPAEPMNISAVAGARRPAYHLLLPAASTETASEILTDVLGRSFPGDHSGWFIDAREARAIIEAAHRLLKVRRR